MLGIVFRYLKSRAKRKDKHKTSSLYVTLLYYELTYFVYS